MIWNNQFKFEYSGPGKDIILFYFNFSNYVDYDIDCPNGGISSSSSGFSEEAEAVAQFGKKGICTIKFESTEEYKGSFVIYTLNNKLSIKLKNKYGNLDTAYEDDDNMISVSQLTFSVPKLDRDVTANFEYSKKSFVSGCTADIDNPFKVCHDKVCEENTTTYEL